MATVALQVRLLQKIEIEAGPSGCWLFTGSIGRNGYGHIRRGGTVALAHRVSYELHSGRPAVGDVDHLCGVRRCINPAHLQDLAASENRRLGAMARWRFWREARALELRLDLRLATATA